MIAFSCHTCGKQYNLKPEFAGRTTTCSGCKESLLIPSSDATATVAPEVKARISFSCPKCAMNFSVLPEFAGRKTTCPTCKEALVVPSPDQTLAYVPPLGKIDGPTSSLAKAEVDAGVTLGGGLSAGKSSLQDLMPGKSGNNARYVIQKELARGGMGAVLRAIDCDIRREVAVKYLLDQSNAKNKIRFVEEAQITGQLEHPNIVPIHELGIDSQKRIFFTMKMVNGRSVGQILKMLRKEPAEAEKEYGLSRLLNIFVNVCNALAYAHSRGVVHRDLKPANIMVGDFGEVYLMDWGLAKVLDKSTSLDTGPPMAMAVATFAGPVAKAVIPLASAAPPMATPVETAPNSAPGGVTHSSGTGKVVTIREMDVDLTQAGSVMGTPVYMPPEQAAGKIHEIDERSDIYSMGAILYEMLTLQPPIDKAGGFWPIVQRVCEGQIEPPEKKAPERARAGKIPVELVAVAMKALAKNKEDRYQTIEDLRKDIDRFAEGRSVSAKQDTIREMAVKLVKRNKPVSIATAAAAVILGVVGVWSLIAILQANSRTQKAHDAYVAEQDDKRKQAKRSVPSMVRAAKMLISENQLDDAFTQVDTAVGFDEGAVDPRFVRAQLLCGRADYAAAGADLEKCVKVVPDRADFKELLDAVKKTRADNTDTLLALSEELSRQKAYAAAAQVTRSAEKLLAPRNKMLAHYQTRINAAWPGAGVKLTCDAIGEFYFDLSGYAQIDDLSTLKDMPLKSINFTHCRGIEDLTPLKGMPLTHLDFYGCIKITDVTPLKGMPLTALVLGMGPKITDLTPLKGMLLKQLSLRKCAKITDWTPLQGMPLEGLAISDCVNFTDLIVLKGMPLTYLDASGCPISDLTPLKDMPLTRLIIEKCPGISDLTPLAGLELTVLSLAGCVNVSELAPLNGMKLTDLSFEECVKVSALTPLTGMPLVNLSISGSRVKSIEPLRKMPLKKFTFSGGNDDIADWTPLKELKLNELQLIQCSKLEDLTPLADMKLGKLVVSGSRVKDLTPLRGMPITHLTLNGCPVNDLTPLRKMPLDSLQMIGCKELHDLTPLAEMRLTYIGLPPQMTKGIEELRAMKALQTIDQQPSGVFWKRWDAAKAKAK